MNVIDQIKREEGCVLHAYPDSLGWQTIGFGRLIDGRKGGGISQDEAEYLLRNDVTRVTKELESKLPWFFGLDEVRRAAVINMAFQLGTGGVLGFPKMLACLRDQRYAEAETHALDSQWAKQTPARAKRVARQLATGEWQ